MRPTKLLLVVSLASGVYCGCSTTIKNEGGVKPLYDIAKYVTLEVGEPSAPPWVDISQSDREHIRVRFLTALRTASPRLKVEEATTTDDQAIVLASRVEYFRLGDQYEDQGEMRIHAALIDKASGDTLRQADLRSKMVYRKPFARYTGEAIAPRLVEFCEAVGLAGK